MTDQTPEQKFIKAMRNIKNYHRDIDIREACGEFSIMVGKHDCCKDGCGVLARILKGVFGDDSR